MPEADFLASMLHDLEYSDEVHSWQPKPAIPSDCTALSPEQRWQLVPSKSLLLQSDASSLIVWLNNEMHKPQV
jgi:hypothetical protein